MRPRDLRFLCCPQCQGGLSLGEGKVDADQEIFESRLTCNGCSASYPIIRGVPTFSESGASEVERQTVSAFGFQWTRFQRQEGFSSSDELFDMFLPDGMDFGSKSVLEAGCGTGRWIPIVARRGARMIVGVDLSEAAYVAYENTRRFHNVLIVRGSVLSLPLKERFDVIYSIGVVQHMPDPKEAIGALGRHLQPSGVLAAWVYSREGNEPYVTLDPLRQFVARWPNRLKLALSYPAGLVLKALLPAWSTSGLPMSKYAGMLRKLSYRDLVTVINDQLAPSIAHYLTRADVESWQEGTGLRIVSIGMRTENSWKILLRRTLG